MEHSVKDDIPYYNLLRAISDLYGIQKLSKTTRKEISPEVSEYAVPTDSSESLAYSLCRSLPCSVERNSKARKRYSLLCKTRALASSEDPAVASRISRGVRYKKLRRTLDQWQTTVQSMRNEEQLLFPLNQDTRLARKNNTAFKPRKHTTVEKKQFEILNDKGSEPEEEREFDMAEVIELRKEKAKLNAQYSYILAKAARHKRIKSKKYHRMLKHKNTACNLENIASLKNLDPEKAKQLLESLEKTRAKERATLRHRNTGQWAQHVKTSTKQSSERQKQLMQQISLSYELTQKLHVSSSSEGEEDEENDYQATINNTQGEESGNNPWVAGPIVEKAKADNLHEAFEPRSLSNRHQNTEKFEIPKNLLHEPSKSKESVHSFRNPPLKRHDTLDPDTFIRMRPNVLQLKDPCLQEESDDNSTVDTAIAEAFAGDDIVTEFRKERDSLSKQSQLEDIEVSIPGWGKWGGKCSARKLNQPATKCHKIAHTKHAEKNNVIFTEDKTDKLKMHQVNEIPLAFTRVEDYEASIRHPIGNTWAPQMAHRKLVSPAIITKLGSVIKPIQKDMLLGK